MNTLNTWTYQPIICAYYSCFSMFFPWSLVKCGKVLPIFSKSYIAYTPHFTTFHHISPYFTIAFPLSSPYHPRSPVTPGPAAAAAAPPRAAAPAPGSAWPPPGAPPWWAPQHPRPGTHASRVESPGPLGNLYGKNMGWTLWIIMVDLWELEDFWTWTCKIEHMNGWICWTWSGWTIPPFFGKRSGFSSGLVDKKNRTLWVLPSKIGFPLLKSSIQLNEAETSYIEHGNLYRAYRQEESHLCDSWTPYVSC